jgi:hypothetical protein
VFVDNMSDDCSPAIVADFQLASSDGECSPPYLGELDVFAAARALEVHAIVHPQMGWRHHATARLAPVLDEPPSMT